VHVLQLQLLQLPMLLLLPLMLLLLLPRLTYQPASIRGVDAGFLAIGQFDLKIPPKQPNYVAHTATCTPACTKQ
jgi:hypothetical protein